MSSGQPSAGSGTASGAGRRAGRTGAGRGDLELGRARVVGDAVHVLLRSGLGHSLALAVSATLARSGAARGP